MKTKYSFGKETYVNFAILVADFVLLNALLGVFFQAGCVYLPEFFHSATKISVLVMNIAMVAAEYYFHAIVYRRVIKVRQIFLNVLRLTLTQAIVAGLLLRMLFLSGGLFRFMIMFFVADLVVIVVSRFVERLVLLRIRKRGGNASAVLLVGHDPSLLTIYVTLMQNPGTGYKVLGYYGEKEIKNCPKSLKRLGNIDDLNKKINDVNGNPLEVPGVDELYCSLSRKEAEEIKRIMDACDRNLTLFFYVPRVFKEFGKQLKPVFLGGRVIYASHQLPLLRFSNRLIKRFFDVVVSLIVCVFLIPISIVVGIIIKIQSRGPVFFRQARTGMDGKTFYCYKYRSMHVNKDADKVQATEHDPRKFPFGDFMRRTNIDELPQFFNVLKGDMSIVGPRPHMLLHTDIYGKLINNYMVRLFAKPGITGWAQINGFRGETKDMAEMEGRVNSDVWYLEHWTFWLDVRIIFLTAKSIFVHDKHAY